MFGMHRHRVKTGGGKRRFSPQLVIQLLSAALFNGYAAGFGRGRIFTGASKAFCVPVLNCYSCPGALGACPIGSIQSMLGGMQSRFPFYVLGLLVLFGAVLGRVVCGLLCPFGLVQDLLHRIPVPKRVVPRRIDRPARYLKYVVLAVLVFLVPAFAAAETGVVPPPLLQIHLPRRHPRGRHSPAAGQSGAAPGGGVALRLEDPGAGGGGGAVHGDPPPLLQVPLPPGGLLLPL